MPRRNENAGFSLDYGTMIVGTLRVEVHIPRALSLKDKRSAVKSLKEQGRGRFNVSIAELDPNEKWQRASLGIATIGGDRSHVEGCLREVADWMRGNPLIELIRVEQEVW